MSREEKIGIETKQVLEEVFNHKSQWNKDTLMGVIEVVEMAPIEATEVIEVVHREAAIQEKIEVDTRVVEVEGIQEMIEGVFWW